MIAGYIKAKLEALHTESFAWAVHCCYKDRAVAAEVLQSSYLKVLEGKAEFKEQAQFKTWLFAIIRYTAIDYYKKAQKQKIIPLTNQEFVITSDTDQLPQQQVFLQGLKELSPNQNRILHLVFYQNLTIQEAAEVMNMQLGTARTHYKRGKKQLRKWLTEAGFAVNGKFILP